MDAGDRHRHIASRRLGSSGGLPGNERGGEVKGFLFSSESLAEHWPRIDEFEGEGYERVLTTVKLEDGTAVDAYIYRLSGNGSPLAALG